MLNQSGDLLEIYRQIVWTDVAKIGCHGLV
ncbi:Uncharacterised protein [Vibrio cholerae]|nr:Uncharacterised protein [Vibrio cholerae]CSI55891.1 Uncharacterised protein [Vibrio cholerae]